MTENKRIRVETRRWPEGQRLCRTCKIIKPNEEFHSFKHGANGRYPHCKKCRVPISSANWANFALDKRLLSRAKGRAKKRNIPFNLTIEDIIIPDLCPVLDVKLDKSSDHTERDTSPSLDRIVPSLGYVKGNVRVISHRANMLKNNATVEEMELVLADLKRLRQEQ